MAYKLNRYFSIEVKMAIKYMKTCFDIFAFQKKCRSVLYYFISVRRTVSSKKLLVRILKKEPLCTIRKKVETSWKAVWSSIKQTNSEIKLSIHFLNESISIKYIFYTHTCISQVTELIK